MITIFWFMLVAMSQGQTQIEFNNAAISGNDRGEISVVQVPVVTPSGTVYRTFSLQFASDVQGNIFLTGGLPILNPATGVAVNRFVPGRYTGPRTINNQTTQITVTGPGGTAAGLWSLMATPTNDRCAYPATATWYSGLASDSPVASRLRQAGITSPLFSYGVIGSGNNESCFRSNTRAWETGNIIGVAQSGNTLIIVSFTSKDRLVNKSKGEDGNEYDRPYPVDQITYVLQ